MLMPVSAMRDPATSGRRYSQSTSGLTTLSQRLLKGIPSTKSNCPWPGPS